MSKKRFIFTIVLAIVLTFTITSLMYRVTSDNNKENTVEEEKQIETEDIKKETDTISKEELKYLRDVEKRFKKVLEIEKIIKENYYKDVSKIDFDEVIYKSMVEELDDKYSKYMTEEEYEFLDSYIFKGKYIGFGYVTNHHDKSGHLRILSIFDDSPATKANLKVGDIILKINGEEIFLENDYEDFPKYKGENEPYMKFTIKRGEKIFDVDIKRGEVTIPTVKSKIIESNVGYIKLNGFQDESAKKFNTELEKLLDQKIGSLIIDLRYNPGGEVMEAKIIADRILDYQVIATIVRKNNYKSVLISDSRSKIDIPFVVLVNDYSASASDIFAATIKDSNAGTIIGEKTYGKGIGQNKFKLSDGSICWLTTMYALSPNGNIIHQKGVEPDVNIEEIKAKGYKVTNENDGVLEYAVDFLKGKIK